MHSLSQRGGKRVKKKEHAVYPRYQKKHDLLVTKYRAILSKRFRVKFIFNNASDLFRIKSRMIKLEQQYAI